MAQSDFNYSNLYQFSIQHPEEFWSQQAEKFITWYSKWQSVLGGDFHDPTKLTWFPDAKLNACYNCIDRHLKKYASRCAIIWEGDDPNQFSSLTYEELGQKINQFANVLKKLGVKKGQYVCIYLPMIPEVIIAMLACARIGAIHNVVFAGFSAQAIRSRMSDTDCRIVVTADQNIRGGKKIALKDNLDEALKEYPHVDHVVVIRTAHNDINWHADRDKDYHVLMQEAESDCAPEIMDSDDSLFVLYTSGSTGKPKGIIHATGGYLVYAATTFKYIFNYQEGDIFWCTADTGWITGHSYLVYGPLLNGATIILFAGVPNYPTYSRYWDIIDKYNVNIFYTSPTALRELRKQGDQFVLKTKRKSLKLLGTVGEPINPDVWLWYFNIVGEKRCPIVDTWWQTETGGISISPLPNETKLKPGSVTLPFFGIVPEIVNEQGQKEATNHLGRLVITKPWPGLMKTIHNDSDKFLNYFHQVQGKYFTGDEAKQDEDGYFWIKGRIDDVLKVSGHRLGSEEIESALLSNKAVSEAAVVPIDDPIKGQAIYAYVVLKSGYQPSDQLKQALMVNVADTLGAIAKPKFIQWADDLPKTRSGKIMRRILKKIANNEVDNLGDKTTLANPTVISKLIDKKV